MSSIHRQPGKRVWFCAFADAEGKRHFRSTRTRDREQAKLVCQEMERLAKRDERLNEMTAWQAISSTVENILESRGKKLPTATVRAYFTRWIADKEHTVAPSSFLKYQGVATQFIEFMGPDADKPMAYVSRDNVVRFHRGVADRSSANTANAYLKILRVVFKRALEIDHVIPADPTKGVALLAKEDYQRQRFTLGEIKAILAVADVRWRAIVLLGLYGGFRFGDIANLLWSNIDTDRWELTVPTRKTGRLVIVPMADPLREALLQLPAADDPTEYVFPDLAGKRSGWLSNQFYDLLVMAGLAPKRRHAKAKDGRAAKRNLGLSFHALRTTASSLLADAGVSDAVARDLIGHDSVAVHRVYTRVGMDAKRQAINKLPDVTKESLA